MRILFLLPLLLSALPSARAEIFYYKDEKGDIHAVDSPALLPEQYRQKTQSVRRLDADQSRVTMQLQRKGNSLLIPVTFNNGATATLILDTGASLTVLPKRIAQQLGLVKSGEITIHAANGAAQAYLARLPEISVRHFTVRDLEVAVHDIPNIEPADGLLGVDFLGRFKMSLDSASGELTLDKK